MKENDEVKAIEKLDKIKTILQQVRFETHCGKLDATLKECVLLTEGVASIIISDGQSRATPEGSVVVPREPTQEMIVAGEMECDNHYWAINTYRAMLTAADKERKECPHKRVDHNLECLDCDEPVYGGKDD